MERFDNLYDELDIESMGGYDDVEDGAKEFEIIDASTADWAISKIAEERKRTQYFIDVAKKEIENLEKQIKDMEDKCERSVQYLSGCLGKYLERDDVPTKKTTTQESITLPAGKIIKKFPKVEYKMANGTDVAKGKSKESFVSEVSDIDNTLIKTKLEVDWTKLKTRLEVTEDGNVIYKDTGEFIESIVAQKTLPSIEVKTE